MKLTLFVADVPFHYVIPAIYIFSITRTYLWRWQIIIILDMIRRHRFATRQTRAEARWRINITINAITIIITTTTVSSTIITTTTSSDI